MRFAPVKEGERAIYSIPSWKSGSEPFNSKNTIIHPRWRDALQIENENLKTVRGVLVSHPTKIENSTVEITGGLDKQELRQNLLLWDKIVWPTNNLFHVGSTPDDEFLISAGVMVRPHLIFSGQGDSAKIAADLHLAAFKGLNDLAPGAWAFAAGPRSFNLVHPLHQLPSAAAVELYRAIPVPDVEVPYAEILEFKMRRRDELRFLRVELDNLGASVSNSENPLAALDNSKQGVIAACENIIKVSREWGQPIRISDLSCKFEIDVLKLGAATVAGYAAGGFIGAPTLGALVGGSLLSGVSLKFGGGIKLAPRRSVTPYEYVSNFHEEVFR